MCIDNVQWPKKAGHATLDRQNDMHLVCNGYAVKNRVSFRGMTDNSTTKAKDLPIKSFLPSQDDYDQLRRRMEAIVSRILVVNLQEYADEQPNDHIQHQYSAESARKNPGFAMCIDNVQWSKKAGHVTLDRHIDMHLVCNGYAVKKRVSFRGMTNESTTEAKYLPIKSFLPSQDDYARLKRRMECIVSRILVVTLKEYADETPNDHIQHQYSAESARKSEYTNMGIVEQNPSTAGGTMKILSEISKYVPEVFRVPIHGDQKTVEQVYTAKVARSTA
eukprot:XP_011680819.1 PREDICTED: uncharacterized protein LOC105446111 [Strongylocentrotus purpuratus]